MIYVRKKDQETVAALLRRFSLRVQQSDIIHKAKRKKFFQKQTNRSARRAAALVREEKRARMKTLWKLGRIKRDK